MVKPVVSNSFNTLQDASVTNVNKKIIFFIMKILVVQMNHYLASSI